jgi:hypothetical protein
MRRARLETAGNRPGRSLGPCDLRTGLEAGSGASLRRHRGDDRVLRVGMAGIVRKGELLGGVGKRLNHHLRTISRSSHPAWWEFTQALRGRDLTV